MQCIAHRGGAGLYPENTLAAFRHAIQLGCHGAELDVQLSRDGEPVVFHDRSLNPEICRGASGHWLAPPCPLVEALTLAELGRFDVGRPAPESQYARQHPHLAAVDGARIPTLAETVALAAAAPGFRLFVELKTSAVDRGLSAAPSPLVDGVLQVLQEAKFLHRAVLVSFDWPALLYAQRKAAVECWFSTRPVSAGAPPVSEDSFAAIARAGAQGWFPENVELTVETIGAARRHGLKVGAWTVNDPLEFRRLIGLGVDAICTDRPDLLLAQTAAPQRPRPLGKVPGRC